ncbi:MBL fold metallo-hydrolase [Aliiroseovarius sp. S2029]|uniref:MBL fold metallo-hydrolase n=1 Tax=Aliiroseovarius sp. S2029 TaxID=2936988 RepID=UPI0020C08E46|nr:MBL fold metallo-hydrolase [Aliiroseovarius sp. S2029]MCK8485277.1 MBL fold metallo-hydrolase [Aliiroseovarius sp. S2029]
MTQIRAVHRFFPVGQGLFATGSVEFWPPARRPRRIINTGRPPRSAPVGPYRWVYDCGTSSGTRLVTNAIDDLKRDCQGEKIDLLTLSHFHNDHINGVVDLLNEIGAKTVMLPWAPLWHRLLIGFEQGLRAEDPEMLFYVDPVQYLIQEADDGFEQVLFVMPSDDDGPPFSTEATVTPEPPEDLDDPDKPSGLGEPVSYGDLEGAYGHLDHRIRMLRSGKAIDIHGVWEFLPYNDPATEPDDPFGFAVKVESLRASLLNGNDDERQSALDDLRTLYETTFGRGAAMNNVSLMLYGGAVGLWTGQSICDCECLYHRLTGVCGCWKKHETRGAILLTGDGNFESAAKWSSLEGYLDTRRARRVSVFQVAHHGARANWHDGLAALVAPKTSVFSSDPRRSYSHPHAEVLRDFWMFGPIQVDQQSGFSFRIHLER